MAFGQAFGQEEFQIPGLGSSFEYALARLDTKCNDMGGSMQLCRRVYNRFNRLRGKMVDIGRSKVQELVVFAIGNAVKDFRRLVRKQFEKPLLFRLATAQKVIDELRRIHFLLDDIYKTLQLTDDPTMTEWQEHWDSDRELQANWFVTKFKETRLREVINQIKGPQGLDDALAQLKFALEIRDRDTNILPKLREVMDKRYNDVLALQNIQGVKIFEWFIPRDDVDIEEDGVLGMGSYGSASRAKWVDSRRAAEEKGQPKTVVVKSLNLTTVETARKSFSDELTIWFGLEHRNVLKLYGACHVGSPQFFVCEYAQDGDILQFFSDPLRRPLLWDMFIQATEGLRYLHEAKQVEHGDLKCNNILVARGNVVKISDFGFAVVRNQSIGVSEKSQQDAIRYKAPEHLSQDDATRDFRKADVYSLGLCIVEAVTQEVIFGTLDEDDIMVEKMRPNHVVRPPDQFSKLEWALIASMCAFDPEKRPSTDEAIKSMDVLRKLEKDKQPDTEPDAEVLRGLEKLHIEQQEGGE